MLAEIFILRIESAARNTDGATWPSGGERFVPIKLPVSHTANRVHAEAEKRLPGRIDRR